MSVVVFAPTVPVPCRDPGVDLELFFHPDDERGRARRDRVRAAQAVCARCPVASECLAFSVREREHYGTWGGQEEGQRRRMWRAGFPAPAVPAPAVERLCRNKLHPIAQHEAHEVRGGRVRRYCTACREAKLKRHAAPRRRVKTCVRGHAMTEANRFLLPGHRVARCRTCWDAGAYPYQKQAS